jgi:hypothetical protein
MVGLVIRPKAAIVGSIANPSSFFHKRVLKSEFFKQSFCDKQVVRLWCTLECHQEVPVLFYSLHPIHSCMQVNGLRRISMQSNAQANTRQSVRPTAPNLVVALFTDSESLRDAVADLSSAGFGKSQISIAFSKSGKRAHAGDVIARSSTDQSVSGGEHSLSWKLKHSFEHDLHRKGIDQTKRTDEFVSDKFDLPYSEVDLTETLSALGVAEDRILLLDREIGTNGSLVLVNPGYRAKEAQAILEHNCGIIRTDTATERRLEVN